MASYTDENPTDALNTLSARVLRQRWSRLFRRTAPAGLSRHLLARMIAYQLQANSSGDLDPETKRFLRRVGSRPDMKKLAASLAAPNRQIASGTLFVREWKGEMHRVATRGKEFFWKDKSYKSLSQIASAITGTRWNGPRFFGLRGKASQREK